MKKQFYSHIVEVQTLYIALDELTLTDKEKNHLKSIIESHLHQTIVDVVLSELPKEDKGMFLERLAEDNHEKTIEFLKKRILNTEDRIRKVAKDLLQELHEDIKQISKS